VGLVVQPHKCTTWSFPACSLVLALPLVFIAIQTTLRFYGPPLAMFHSPFPFARCFGWRCSPCKCDFKIGGCLGYFQDLISMFCIKVFLFALCFSTPLKLSTPICFLWLNPHPSFQMVFRSVFFECLKAPVVHRQVLLPIFNEGIGFIYIKTIAPTSYLGNCALVAQAIIFMLLLDSHPFLSEVSGASNSSSLPF